MDMDMVRPRQDPWGLYPSPRPWEAWGSLMDRFGRFRPVGPPRLSCEASVGRVCHCHCGGDCGSRHSVRLVWDNGSFGCQIIAARTRDVIPKTVLAVTSTYSTIPVLLWDCRGQPNPNTSQKCECDPAPIQGMVQGTRCHAWVILSPPPRFALRRGVKRYPEPMAHGLEAATPARTPSTPSVSVDPCSLICRIRNLSPDH